MAKKYGSAALEKAKAAAHRARTKAKEGNSSMVRRGVMLGTAYGAGMKEDWLDRASVGPLSGAVTIGLGAMLLGSKMGGYVGNAAEGVADSMLTIASFKEIGRAHV